MPEADNSLALFLVAVSAVLWYSTVAAGLSYILVRWLLPIYWDDLKSVFHRLRDARHADWMAARIKAIEFDPVAPKR